jgi:hypothetical protein
MIKPVVVGVNGSQLSDAEKGDTEKRDTEKRDAERRDAERRDAERRDAERRDKISAFAFLAGRAKPYPTQASCRAS